MPSINEWEKASSPNYGLGDREDKIFPYSEVPYIGQYKLVKIPQGSSLIDLVDYWGEGRINTEQGNSGYPDCYNINHPFQCVSNGPDRGRKIPNRIPVQSYTTCDSSSYVKENSVRTVTLMGAPINNSCAKDIARMVNRVEGKVVVFGFNRTTADIKNLESELGTCNFIHCADYVLPNHLKGLTLFDTISNVSLIRQEFRQNILSGDYDTAVGLSKVLAFSSYSDTITEVINELLEENNKNVISFAYKLWNGDAQNVVDKHFPRLFKHIFKEDFVTIVNKKNNLALKLAYALDRDNDRMAWGDGNDKTSKRVAWQLFPVWNNNKVSFKLLNFDGGMFLKLAAYKDNIDDREAWGSFQCDTNRHLWYLDPAMLNGALVFFVVNVQYGLGLKLAVAADDIGDRQLWGHSADVHGDPDRFGWYINPRIAFSIGTKP